MNETWSDRLKPGDEVAVTAGWSGFRVGIVERVTATQVVLAGGMARYRRDNGRMVGASGYTVSKIRELTPELKEKIELAKGIEWLKSVAPSVTLKQVMAMKVAFEGAA